MIAFVDELKKHSNGPDEDSEPLAQVFCRDDVSEIKLTKTKARNSSTGSYSNYFLLQAQLVDEEGASTGRQVASQIRTSVDHRITMEDVRYLVRQVEDILNKKAEERRQVQACTTSKEQALERCST